MKAQMLVAFGESNGQALSKSQLGITLSVKGGYYDKYPESETCNSCAERA